MGLTLGSQYGGQWSNTAALVSQLQGAGVNESELSTAFQTYVSKTGATGADIPWWSDAAATRVYLQGLEWAYPDRYHDAFNRFTSAGYWSRDAETAGQARTANIGMADQAKNGKKAGIGGLGALAAIAGIVTGGLSLIGSLGSAAVGAAGAGLAEVAGLAALDAGFVGAAGASSISAAGIGAGAAGIGATVGSIASIARPAFSVASGINTLTGGSSRTPPPSSILNRNTNTMANPFYVIATEPDNGKQQSAAPASVGKTPPPAALGMGVSGNTLALLAVAAVAWYAFSQDK